MKDDQLREQVNAIIRDEIQEGINEYLDTQEESEKTGLGFVQNKDEKLKVNIPHAEVDRLINFETSKILLIFLSSISSIISFFIIPAFSAGLSF